MPKPSLLVQWLTCILAVASMLPLPAAGQDTNYISVDNVLDIVRKYHPVARQANLLTQSAEAERLAARGAFDPVVDIDNEQKKFAGTSYYYHTKGELRIPTWYGIDLKGGFENNGGSRLFDELTSGPSSFVGISMPVLKGLALDKRRAALQQARIIVNQAEAERLNAYNDLLFEAAAAYWEWARAWRVYLTISRVVENSRQRFQLTRRSYLGGDRAAIDTTEALTQLQTFLLSQAEAQYEVQGAGLQLSTFLWLDNDVPYQLPDNVLPDSQWLAVNIPVAPLPVLEEALAVALQNHPKLRSLAFKGDVLTVERRLKMQNLLPSLKLNYNFLRKGYEPWKGVGQQFLDNNYKYGFQFNVPLFLRQARGEVTLANIKLRDNQLERSQTAVEIENKVRNYFNQVVTLRQQVAVFEDAIVNYSRLLQAEERKFEIGESSLFLINSRENKLLEAAVKLTELRAKYFKALVAVQWAAGQLQ